MLVRQEDIQLVRDALKKEKDLIELPCKLAKNSLDTSGYALIKVGDKLKKLHRVAWEAANGPIPDGLIIRHKCDVRHCYEITHLELGTKQDNMDDRNNRNRQAKGSKNGRSKLTEEDVKAIRKSKLPRSIIAHRYNVSVGTIYTILDRKTWKHVS